MVLGAVGGGLLQDKLFFLLNFATLWKTRYEFHKTSLPLAIPQLTLVQKITCASPFVLKLLSFDSFDDVISRVYYDVT